MKLRISSLESNSSEKFEEKEKVRTSFFTTGLRRRYLFTWIFTVMLAVWLINSFQNIEKCSNGKKEKTIKNVEFLRLKDDLNEPALLDNLDIEVDHSSIDEEKLVKYDRNMPILFVGGVPRSGTTLMRAMLDAHPDIRCGEETRVIPRMIDIRNLWLNTPIESERLEEAGITNELIDSALSAFILEIIVKHGKPAQHLCNKDPLVLRHSAYVKNLFPNAKFILMIRDGRASVHSIITRKVTIKGFDLTSWKDCLTKWNKIIEKMYDQCMDLGPSACLPVYYEQLVLHPEKQMREILKFLDIKWDESVIHHEKFIGDEISLSKIEFSSDQVIKPVNLEALTAWVGTIPDNILKNMDHIAPMLKRLGYDPNANPPKYGEADLKIKENTADIKRNSEYWKELSKKYSNLVRD